MRRGLTGFFVAAVARGERGALVARLVGQRSAYQIPEVARAAERMASMHAPLRARPRADPPRLRRRGHRARNGRASTASPSASLPHADDLLGLAFLIASDGVKVHPASLALLDRLLGSTARSPLYSRAIPEQHLRIAIQRIRASIDA